MTAGAPIDRRIRWGAVVLDCPDPVGLAEFYASVLGTSFVETDVDWADVEVPSGPRLSFQLVEHFVPPDWPGTEHPQQAHLDLDVDNLDEAELFVLSRGAVKAQTQPGVSFRVFLDPAGHPFCLVKHSG
jgi:hypothetical protein